MYLDNAATTFPKPDCVSAAVSLWMQENGAAFGRGIHEAAGASGRIVEECRYQVARLLGVPQTQQVVFTFNCTDSLNLLLRGILNPGDRIVTSRLEHNSVLRPLTQLRKEMDLEFELADFDPQTGLISLTSVEQLLRRLRPRLAVFTHASNVTGSIQPIAELTRMAHDHGALVVLDAAQTAGHLPLSMEQLGVDFLAAAGHKGLLGPLGTGIMAIRSGLETSVRPIRCGGTGSNSESLDQPEAMPFRFESGNLNMPGLVGLHAATRWLLQETTVSVHARLARLTDRLCVGLQQIPGVITYGTHGSPPRTGIIAFNVGRMDCRDVATILEQSFQILCRAGLHCAPLAHATLGTQAWGGAVRFSPGYGTSDADIDAAVDAVSQIAASA